MSEVLETILEDESTEVVEDSTENEETTLEVEEVELTPELVAKQIEEAVSAAIARNNADWEKKSTETAQKAVEQAKAYSEMTDEELKEADYNKRVADIEKRENNIKYQELVSTISADLQEKNLPTAWATTLALHDDAEIIKQTLAAIKEGTDKLISNALEKSVIQEKPESSYKGFDDEESFSIADIASKARIIK